ncbi:alpha/beta-hydrolase [Marasmius fiardii PR-910]|nr:alpha/beta-hydrolase [Marasmius fiardii PR-910]
MEESFYKDVKVSRGFKYHFFTSFPSVKTNKSTIVFIHGFGVASKDWRHQIAFFQEKGYSIVAPDLLGYGGSDMPHSPHDLRHSLLAQDILEILDSENIDKAFFVAQGGGSPIMSRFAQLHSNRVIGCAFLAISYAPPNPNFNYNAMLELQKKQFGRELFGYWDFVANNPDAPEIVKNNFEAFFNLLYPDDPASWSTTFGPRGALEDYLRVGKALPSPSWFPEQERKFQYEGLLKLDLKGPFSYYKAYLLGVQNPDAKVLPPTLDVPVFFGAALDDYISLPAIGKELTSKFCTNEKVAVHNFKANHWFHLHVPDQVNDVLLKWFEGFQ